MAAVETVVLVASQGVTEFRFSFLSAISWIIGSRHLISIGMANQERERNDEARRMSNNAVSVLIIDDDRPTPRLLKRGLAASKYRPVEAGTGEDGLDLLSSKRPDIGSSSDQPAKGCRRDGWRSALGAIWVELPEKKPRPTHSSLRRAGDAAPRASGEEGGLARCWDAAPHCYRAQIIGTFHTLAQADRRAGLRLTRQRHGCSGTSNAICCLPTLPAAQLALKR